MDIATHLVLLAGAVVVLAPLARRIGVAAPLLLVVAGVLVSYVPAVPEYKLDPDVVLVGILPPLLYAAALRTSLIDARRDKRAIALLSVGLVVFSTLVVGIAHMGDTGALGRVGLRSLGWFICASLLSLTLGMILVNVLQPGVGLALAIPPAIGRSGAGACTTASSQARQA